NDVRAVRVLVDDLKDCYAALGSVHSLWTPLPKEFDDYIAKPKRNDYRSLRTGATRKARAAIRVTTKESRGCARSSHGRTRSPMPASLPRSSKANCSR